MTDQMLEQQLSASTDTLSGIRIEESLKSQFNSPDQGITDRQVGRFQFPISKFCLQKWDRCWWWWCWRSARAGHCRPQHDHQWELRRGVRPHLQPLQLLHTQHQGRHGGGWGPPSHDDLRQTQKCYGELVIAYILVSHICSVWSITVISNKVSLIQKFLLPPAPWWFLVLRAQSWPHII